MSPVYLPNKANAYVPLRKVEEYLLSETHAIGKSKAKFFRSLGFDEATADKLQQGLLDIAQTGWVKEQINTPYGVKYVIDGLLEPPCGTVVRIRTIWIIEFEDRSPRFVTAYPLE